MTPLQKSIQALIDRSGNDICPEAKQLLEMAIQAENKDETLESMVGRLEKLEEMSK